MNNISLKTLFTRHLAATSTDCLSELPSTPAPGPVISASPGGVRGLGSGEKKEGQSLIAVCQETLRREPENPLCYLALGRAYLAAGKKHLALHAFRKGLRFGHHPALESEIRRLGFRRSPIFPFLGRKHPLNRTAGRLLARFGWR